MIKPCKSMQNLITSIADRHGVNLREVGAHLTISNGGYMPLNIETIDTNVIAVSHTYIQNGDLMRDPEMLFFWGAYWIPFEVRMDNLGMVQRSVVFTNGKATSYYPGKQHDQATFASQWARNLKEQGFHKTTVAA